MAKKTKDSNLSLDESLEQALIPNWDEPYKLPPNWCWVKLSSVSIFERGITFPASAKESLRTTTNIPCLRTANVQESLKLDDLLYVDRSYVKDNSNKLVREKDIIMSTANSRELVGKTSFVHSLTEEMTFGGFVMAIRSKIDPKYLFYFLRLQFLNGKFMGNSTQTTNIANINSATLGETETPIPPLEEQKRIVVHIESLFAKLDEAKEKAQEVVDGFETRKAAILHKAFSGELTKKWRDACNVSIESWQKVDLIDVLIDKPRNGFSPKPVDYVTPYKSMTLSATTSGVFLPEHFKYVDETIPMDSYLWLKPGDILIQRANSLEKVGTSAIYTGKEHDFIYPDLMMKLQVKGNTSAQYISYHLKTETVLRYLRSNATGTAGNMPKINQKTVSSIPINLPTLKEQEEIVRSLDMLINKEKIVKETAETVIEQIDTMKKAILARAFRGELSTNNPDEESAVELLKKVLGGDADVQAPAKKPTKRTSIPSDIKELLSNIREEEIIKLLLKASPQPVSIQEIMSLSSKKFELMDALRSLEKKRLITKNESGEYSLTR